MRLLSIPKSRSRVLFGGLVLLAACTTPPVGPTATLTLPASPAFTPLPSATAQQPATATSPPAPAARATATPIQIPGFESWTVFKPQAVEVAVEDGALILTLRQRALWFMNERGVLVYQLVTGNFKITANVLAARASDPSQPPGQGRSVQLGGLMARDGSAGTEDYVFIVVGYDGDGLSVETKTTQDSESQWKGPAWGSGQAGLRLCRFGDLFHLYKRHAGTAEAWTLAESFQRPDLPETLQVGANIYSDSVPDLTVRYDDLRIEPVSGEADCTAGQGQ